MWYQVVSMKGQRFGRWTVLGQMEFSKTGERKWLCRCDCGTERFVLERSLLYGGSQSCGCLRKERAKEAVSADLTGKAFGELTVLGPAPAQKAGGVRWLCRCICGTEYTVLGTLLLSGRRTRCPNHRKNYAVKDIAGQRFFRLTARYPAEAQNGRGIVWHCRCDCGGEIDAPLHQLTAGYRKSCGCLSHPPLKDYLGKRFSMLTVTGYAGKEDGQHLWRCKCDCGKETVVRQTNLQSGKTKSCGCLQEKQLLENLKLCEGTSVTILEAGRRRLRPTNTSGVTGVYRNRRTGRWCAQITFKRKTYYLGAYEKKDDAIRARKRGEGLHENFIAWYYATHQLTEGRP